MGEYKPWKYDEEDIRLFIKCKRCGHVAYTKHAPLLSLIASSHTACSGCSHSLNYAEVLVCTRGTTDDCGSCEHRFLCFTSKPLEDVIDVYGHSTP